jgi:mono/diheme cytochrome c family protein
MKTSIFFSMTGVLSLLCMSAASAGHARPAAAGQKPAAEASAKASPESIANGAALFKRQCVMCHGAEGHGDGPAAKNLKGKLPSLADKAVMSKLTDAQLHELITNGKKSEIGNMPALGKRLKPEEITDVVNFVRTLAK